MKRSSVLPCRVAKSQCRGRALLMNSKENKAQLPIKCIQTPSLSPYYSHTTVILQSYIIIHHHTSIYCKAVPVSPIMNFYPRGRTCLSPFFTVDFSSVSSGCLVAALGLASFCSISRFVLRAIFLLLARCGG